MMQSNNLYSSLDPRGDFVDIHITPLSKRIDNFNSKTVYFVDNGKQGAEFILKTFIKLMENNYTDINLVYYPKTTSFNRPEPKEWWDVIYRNADAAVVALGD